MPVQIVGNRPVDAIPYSPRAETTNNPGVFSKIKEPSARNWNSLGSPTNLPDFQSRPPLSLSDRLSGRSPAQLSPQVGKVTPSSVPTGNPNLSARLAGQSPSVVPGGIGGAVESPLLASVPTMRIPGGATGGLLAAGFLTALPTELPRLMGLVSNPQQYWRDEDNRFRALHPDIYALLHPAQAGVGLQQAVNREALGVVPFQGGQTPGTQYSISYRLRYKAKDGTGEEAIGDGQTTAWGPIRGTREIVSGGSRAAYIVAVASATSTAELLIPIGSTANEQVNTESLSILNVTPIGGNPDTGGNPPPVPVPGSTSRPPAPQPTGRYIAPTPSRTPTAVPLNNPRSLPIGSPSPAPGQKIAAEPTQALNPLSPASTIAPTISPEQLKRVSPDPGIIPAGLPASAKPHTGLSIHEGVAGGRLGQEGQYGQTIGEYFNAITPESQTTPTLGTNAATGETPGLVPALALGAGILGGLALSNWNQSRTTTITTGAGTGTDTGTAGDPDITPIGGTAPNTPGFCRFAPDPYTPQISRRTGRIEALDIGIKAFQTEQLTSIQSKLGDALPGGKGISGYLQGFWQSLNLTRTLSILTFLTTVHNAIMLSNNIGQTLFSAFDGILNLFNQHLKDEKGENIDTSQFVGNQIESLLSSLFGKSNIKELQLTWAKANRIYQAASNIVSSFQSVTYSIINGLETVGNYVAKIGNAARKFGVVAEKAYGFMNPNLDFSQSKVFDVINHAQDAVSALDTVVGESVSVRDSFNQLKEEKDTLTKEVGLGEETKTTEEAQKKTDSQTPKIEVSDQIKPAG